MKIVKIINEYFQENTYIINYLDKTIVIDPGSDLEKILLNINNKLDYIFLTHGHMDHIYNAKALSKLFNCNIFASKLDDNYIKGNIILDYYFDKNKYKFNYIDYHELILEDLEIINTPGHSKGSVCIYFKNQKVLFSGDTIFKGSFGRFDFEESCFDDLIKSFDLLFKLDDDVKIYPGHGDFTTIKDEKNYNIIKFYKNL